MSAKSTDCPELSSHLLNRHPSLHYVHAARIPERRHTIQYVTFFGTRDRLIAEGLIEPAEFDSVLDRTDDDLLSFNEHGDAIRLARFKDEGVFALSVWRRSDGPHRTAAKASLSGGTKAATTRMLRPFIRGTWQPRP